MKRSILPGDDAATLKKKAKVEDGGDEAAIGVDKVLSDENLLCEILKRVDGKSLARASCVCRQWYKAAVDERLWELICTEHYAKIPVQLRSVVLALGGFRRLFSQYLWPLLKPTVLPLKPIPGNAWPCVPVGQTNNSGGRIIKRWGKDEVSLSLSLLSIRYYEKMNFANRFSSWIESNRIC